MEFGRLQCEDLKCRIPRKGKRRGEKKRRRGIFQRATYPRDNRIVAREMRLAVLAAEYLVRVEVGVVNEAHTGRCGPKQEEGKREQLNRACVRRCGSCWSPRLWEQMLRLYVRGLCGARGGGVRLRWCRAGGGEGGRFLGS